MYYCMFHKCWIDDKDKLKKRCLESKSNKKGCKTKKCKYLVEFENEMLDKVNKKTQNIKKVTNNS